jgi:hypothetical protein
MHGKGKNDAKKHAIPNAFPLDSLGFGVYTSPVGRRQESMAFLDPFEGTEMQIESQWPPHNLRWGNHWPRYGNAWQPATKPTLEAPRLCKGLKH